MELHFNTFKGIAKLFFISTLILITGFLVTSCQKIDPFTSLESKIRKITTENEGSYAIAFQDLQDSSNSIFINERLAFHAASTMKSPVMYHLYKKVKEGQVKLTDSILVKNEFTSIIDSSLFSMDLNEDSGEKFYSLIGKKASLYDLCFDMITRSSNLATNILMEELGADAVNQSMREIGAMDINILRGVEDLKAFEAGKSNTTTAYDLFLFFEKLGNYQLIDSTSSQAMIDVLSKQAFDDIIPDLLPKDVVVAHKTGQITQVMHDSGLVILPDGRKYVLVLLSKDWISEKKARMNLSKISGLIYQYMK